MIPWKAGGIDQQQVLMTTADNASNMIEAEKILGEINEKDDESI